MSGGPIADVLARADAAAERFDAFIAARGAGRAALAHATALGVLNAGAAANASVGPEQVRLAVALRAAGRSYKRIAAEAGMSVQTVRVIVEGHHWTQRAGLAPRPAVEASRA